MKWGVNWVGIERGFIYFVESEQKKIQSGVSRRTTERERKQIWTYVMKSRLIMSVYVYYFCSNWSIVALDHMTPISIAFPIAKQSPNHNVCVIFGQCQSVSCSSEEKKNTSIEFIPGKNAPYFACLLIHTQHYNFLKFHQVVQQVIIIVILYKAS